MADGNLRLRVATPSGTVVDEPVTSLRAEDDSGHFGLRPGHETFFTSLATGIVMYRTPGGAERYVAVRRGVLWLEGEEAAVVTRDAVAGDDMADLENRVVAAFVQSDEEERKGQSALTKMQVAALRMLLQYEDVGPR